MRLPNFEATNDENLELKYSHDSSNNISKILKLHIVQIAHTVVFRFKNMNSNNFCLEVLTARTSENEVGKVWGHFRKLVKEKSVKIS